MKYRAFISYSHADSAVVKRLHRGIEGFRVPGRLVGRDSRTGPIPKRLYPVFRDREELPTSSDLGEMIENALAESAYLVVVCSPRAAKSQWVNEEIRTFKQSGRSDRVLCLIVDGEPNATDIPGRADEECFPPAVRYAVDPDSGELLNIRTEPIAADARPQGDGEKDARLKVIAGLLGVGFDELKRRDQQRRTRRLLAGMTVSLLIAVGAIALAAVAMVARHEAQQRADTLLEYSVTNIVELNDAIRDVPGTAKARELLVGKSVEHLDNLPDDVDPAIQYHRAVGYLRIAEVVGMSESLGMARSHDAIEWIDRAIAILESLDEVEGVEPALIAAELLGGKTERIYYNEMLEGNAASAEQYEAILREIDSLPIDIQNHEEVRFLRPLLQYYLGGVYSVNSSTTEALDWLQRARSAWEELLADHEIDEDSVELRLGLVATLIELHDVFLVLNQPGNAEEAQQAASDQLSLLLTIQPMRTRATIFLSQINMQRGDSALNRGDVDAAFGFYTAADRAMLPLHLLEPDEPAILASYSAAMSSLAKLTAERGNLEQAALLYNESVQLASRLANMYGGIEHIDEGWWNYIAEAAHDAGRFLTEIKPQPFNAEVAFRMQLNAERRLGSDGLTPEEANVLLAAIEWWAATSATIVQSDELRQHITIEGLTGLREDCMRCLEDVELMDANFEFPDAERLPACRTSLQETLAALDAMAEDLE